MVVTNTCKVPGPRSKILLARFISCARLPSLRAKVLVAAAFGEGSEHERSGDHDTFDESGNKSDEPVVRAHAGQEHEEAITSDADDGHTNNI